ncbi:unnamed protein product [Caenorhabditis brenneri]
MSQTTVGNNGTADASTQTKITEEQPKTTVEEAVMEYLRERRLRMIRERNQKISRVSANFRRNHIGAQKARGGVRQGYGDGFAR